MEENPLKLEMKKNQITFSFQKWKGDENLQFRLIHKGVVSLFKS